jgi:hypothetical protein
MTPVQEYILEYAQSRGYKTVNFHRPTAGRGHAPIDLDELIAELIDRGWQFDECFAPGQPFFSEVHPDNPKLYMWSYSDSGIPNYVTRIEFISSLRRELQRRKRVAKPSSSAHKLRARIAELESKLSEARKALARVELHRVSLACARRAVASDTPQRLMDGTPLTVEDACWMLDNAKVGRPLSTEPSPLALYMRQYRASQEALKASLPSQNP